MECFYLIEPHARNCFGMPDPNGICFEAWSKPKAPYVCSRCSRDKNEMKDLTQIEEMLIACALWIMKVCIKRGGQRVYTQGMWLI
jgi:DNA-directed RNA polymerase subunit RPC12/RpoP